MKYLAIIAALTCTMAMAKPPTVVPVQHGPRVPKIKIFRSNPHRLTAIRLQGTDPYDAPDDDYICNTPSRRHRASPFEPEPEDDTVSDYVAVRLAVARARAMAHYRNLHT